MQVLLMRRPGGAEALLRTELCVRVWLPARSGQVTRGKRGGGGTIVTRHTDRGGERERERDVYLYPVTQNYGNKKIGKLIFGMFGDFVRHLTDS